MHPDCVDIMTDWRLILGTWRGLVLLQAAQATYPHKGKQCRQDS